jgi:iron complex transport system substrate-binding protein
MNKIHRLFHGVLLLLLGYAVMVLPAHSDVSVRDDTGRMLTLKVPARRIVSLAPNVTELLYAAGAGDSLVGAVQYSDYPEAAKKLPRVGSGAGLDLEAIVALHPDLIIGWQTGNPAWQVERLVGLGIPVFITEPRRLGDVPNLLERFGKLTGMEVDADLAARKFRRHEKQLRDRYSRRATISVFYQILDSSLFTVSGRHIISDVIRLCGGNNIFADLADLTPRVDVESVLKKNPQVILASGFEPLWLQWRESWRKWPMLSAVAHDDLFLIPPDLIERQSPRILDGADRVCAVLEQARSERRLSENR